MRQYTLEFEKNYFQSTVIDVYLVELSDDRQRLREPRVARVQFSMELLQAVLAEAVEATKNKRHWWNGLGRGMR